MYCCPSGLSRRELTPRVGVAGIAQEWRPQQAPDVLHPRIHPHNAQRPTPHTPFLTGSGIRTRCGRRPGYLSGIEAAVSLLGRVYFTSSRRVRDDAKMSEPGW
jgi:hypothetical protein